MSGADVLHITGNAGFGGMATQARDIAGELHARGRLASVLIADPGNVGESTRQWYAERVPVDLLSPQTDAARGIDRVGQLRRLFLGYDEKIVHYHSLAQDFLDWRLILAAALAGKCVVVTCHHTVEWRQGRRLAMIGQRLGWFLSKKLVTTTAAGWSLVSERVRSSKLCIVPCAICPPARRVAGAEQEPAFSTAAANREHAVGQAPRRAWAASPPGGPMEESDRVFVVSCVCRIIKYKGVFDVAEAVADIYETDKLVRLDVVGVGPDYDELVSRWGTHPAINIHGRVDDVGEVLERSDLFAMPSSEEGFGLVYGEAATLGVPSIACDLPTVREVVVDGETGWLIEPGDKATLRRVLTDAMADANETRRRGDAAKEYVRRFELGAVVDQLESIYDEILRR